MKVYVVSHGYDYEGAIVVKVFYKEEAAINYVLNLPPEIEEREDGTDIEYKMKVVPPKNSGSLYFSNDYGEYYTINEFEVI